MNSILLYEFNIVNCLYMYAFYSSILKSLNVQTDFVINRENLNCREKVDSYINKKQSLICQKVIFLYKE